MWSLQETLYISFPVTCSPWACRGCFFSDLRLYTQCCLICGLPGISFRFIRFFLYFFWSGRFLFPTLGNLFVSLHFSLFFFAPPPFFFWLSSLHLVLSPSFSFEPPWHLNLQSEFILSPHQSHGREGAVSSASVSSSLPLSRSPPCACIAPSHPPAQAFMLQKVLQKEFFSPFLRRSIVHPVFLPVCGCCYI